MPTDTPPLDRLSSFEEFWPFYVGEHRRPGCRAMHYLGGALALMALGFAIVLRSAGWLIAVPLLGYGVCWLAHGWIEHNRPATWRYVRWSLRAEAKMFWLGITGRMHLEVIRLYGSRAPAPDSPCLLDSTRS